MPLTYISMFSGIEAASVAFHLDSKWGPSLGWEPVCFSEIEKFPCAVLAHHFPNVPNVGDMTKHDWSQYRGKVDLVCGGPPCQAFSIAGLRGSMTDARGNLSLAYVRAIIAIRPRWFLVENVPGWCNTPDNAFGCFLAGILGGDAPLESRCEGGGWPDSGIASGPDYGLAWTIKDAQHFGVPQRRRRVFVVGRLGDWRGPAQVLFEPKSLQWDSTEGQEAGQGSPADAGQGIAGSVSSKWAKGTGGPAGDECYNLTVAHALRGRANHSHREDSDNIVAHSLKGEGHDGSEDGTGRGVPLVPIAMRMREGKDGGGKGPLLSEDKSLTLASGNDQTIFDMRGNGDGGTSPTITGDHASRPTDYTPMVFTHEATPKVSSDCEQSLDAQNERRMSVQSGACVRRLTPRECERLQGFPDDFTRIPYRGKPAEDCPDGNRYKAIGNSWAVPCARWIGERIMLVEAK